MLANTRKHIAEMFGLIPVEGYGGKVRLWTEAELPGSQRRPKPRPAGGRDTDQHCLAIW
jgi:hypothetical protein